MVENWGESRIATTEESHHSSPGQFSSWQTRTIITRKAILIIESTRSDSYHNAQLMYFVLHNT